MLHAPPVPDRLAACPTLLHPQTSDLVVSSRQKDLLKSCKDFQLRTDCWPYCALWGLSTGYTLGAHQVVYVGIPTWVQGVGIIAS